MAKLVDAPASGAGTVKGVEVRVLFRAPKDRCRIVGIFFLSVMFILFEWLLLGKPTYSFG